MIKRVTLRNGDTVLVRDDAHVQADEICCFELENGKYEFAPYSAMIGRPHKKVWKLLSEDPRTKSYKMKQFVKTIVWYFLNLFFKKYVMRHGFEISIGLRETKNSFYKFSPKKMKR